MKATLSKRRHPAPSTRHAKRRPVRHARRAHKAHRAAAAAAAPLAASEEAVPMGGEEVVVFDAVFTEPADKREEELSDEEILDREERQELY